MKRPHDEVGPAVRGRPPDDSARTALVLGGGGSAGNAWLIGVLAGLSEGGADPTRADVVVGTSAGSTAAAQILGATASDLLDAVLTPPAPPPARGSGTGPARGRARLTINHLERLRAIIAASEDAVDWRRRMGAALASDAASDDLTSERWRATVAARFPTRDWPMRRLLITAVDADSGEPVVFDRRSGVDLVDAVAASCAGGFAYRVGDRRYIDGGYRANADNADLAAGCARVLVLSPLGGRSLTPVEWGTHLTDQVDALRAEGSVVETVFPDDASRAAFGDDMMDPSTRPPAARAGYEQGKRIAVQLAELWS
ncbi:patatin-like phospholipase family protein [Agromyces flavus]|nr:patatin-like phospholipase family protein [Agromyces flavus]